MNAQSPLIIQQPVPQSFSGIENMRLDEQMLEFSITHKSLNLRFYQWSEATLSLGYFQKPDSLQLPEACRQLPVVRRLTGGGAIVHDHELTYGLSIPNTHQLAHDPSVLYEIVHQVFIAALQQQKVLVSLRGTAQTERDSATLCFLRGDSRDVLYGSDKILGSAQRRRKGAVLQHGSLLLKRSAYAPELPGLEDLCGAAIDLSRLLSAVTEQLQQQLT